MDILAEGMTYNVPHPDGFPPEDIAGVAQLINSPDPAAFDNEALLEPMLRLAVMHGASGSMPGLQRSLVEKLSDMLISRLDIEAGVNPSAAQMLLNQPLEGLPSMDEFLTSRPIPKFSEFFQGASPVDSPDVLNQKLDELTARLQAGEPEFVQAERSAVEQLYAEREPTRPAVAHMIEGMNPESSVSRNLTARLDEIRQLANISDLSPEESTTVITKLLGDIMSSSDYAQEELAATLRKAFEQANIGSEFRIPGMDPSGRRSLAPDFYPPNLNESLRTDGNSEEMIALLNQLMGTTATQPRGGV